MVLHYRLIFNPLARWEEEVPPDSSELCQQRDPVPDGSIGRNEPEQPGHD